MDKNKEIIIIILISTTLLWLWFPYVIVLIGFTIAASCYQGELSAKNGEAPVGSVTKSTYNYSKNDKEPANISRTTKTSQIGHKPGPKIEEIKDSSFDSESRRYSKEYIVEEVESNETRRKSSGLNEDNVKAFTSILKNREEGQEWNKTRRTSDEDAKKPFTRGDSVKALQHKFQQQTEAANNQPTSRYPKAGLILRTNSLHHHDDANQLSSSMKQSNVERTDSRSRLQESKSTTLTTTQVTAMDDSRTVKTPETLKQTMTETTTRNSSGATSFLDNTSKVTGVQDILTRMRNADLVTEVGDSDQDAEARALLNKFLGASVILQGMEQGMKAAQAKQGPTSAALVSQAEKHRVKTTSRTEFDDIEEITDEKQLKILLDSCTDYEGRRKIRARLRTVMAEKGVGEEMDRANLEEIGELLKLRKKSYVEDSGTESGEERHLNPEVVMEVQSALSRLEGVIPGLDPAKRSAVTQLVSSLQNCLKIAMPPPIPPPRRFGSKRSLKNRHTVGVAMGDLIEARKWIDDSSPKTSDDINTVFRPVKFSPARYETPKYTQMFIVKKFFHRPILHRVGYFMEPAAQNAMISFVQVIPKVQRSFSDTGSLLDYDPSLALFTPEQTVQIAVHKAAINKQIRGDTKRGSSDDGDVSSADEEQEISSAQKLLQLATESDKKIKPRNNKKLKLKRANTIDIPKPSFYDYSSDDYGVSADESNHKGCDDLLRNCDKLRPPSFEPKTENDHKFLAFLKQVNDNSNKVASYNPLARGGKHWQNRFSSIKTNFEPQHKTTSPAKLFWQKSESERQSSKTPTPKVPWSVKTAENGIVVGSLTVSKPINNFNHAPKSVFRPIEKKPTTPISGSVKQIAAQKFTEPKLKTKSPFAFLDTKLTNSNQTHKFYNVQVPDKPKLAEKPKVQNIYHTQPLKESLKQPYLSSNSIIQPSKIVSNIVVNNSRYPLFQEEKKEKLNHLNNKKEPIYANRSMFEPVLKAQTQKKTDYNAKENYFVRTNGDFKNQDGHNLYGLAMLPEPKYQEVTKIFYPVEKKETQYLCNLRDASTINAGKGYVSNIPVETVVKDGQYISITPKSPKSRTPIDDESKSPIHSDNVYFNNTKYNFPYNNGALEDPRPIENYLNVKLDSNVSPKILPRLSVSPKSPLSQNSPDSPIEEKAVSRVMGQAQCQSAVTLNNRTRTRYDEPKNIQSELKVQLAASVARQKNLSPTFPNVLQKSESWHQMIKEQMQLAKQAPPLPRISKAKSSHSLAIPKQFEAALPPETITNKKITVSQYLAKQSNHSRRQKHKSLGNIANMDLDEADVDEAFETIFQEANRKRNSK